MSINAFKAYKYPTQNVVLDGSVKTITLPIPARSNDAIKIGVSGTAAAFIETGKPAASASTSTSQFFLPNSVEVQTLDEGDTTVSINGAAGSTVYITMGVGL